MAAVIGIGIARWYIFSNQKSKFGKILVGLGTEKVGIFYGQRICHGHLVYIFYGQLVN
jgi:hypothetical protein